MDTSIKTKPSIIRFSLPFTDDSGDRLYVRKDANIFDVCIGDISSQILIRVEDINWLIQVLIDVQQITKMSQP